MNVMQMIQSGGNPANILSQMMRSSQYANNPIMKNTFELFQRGDSRGLEELARNVCREKGINPDDIMRQFKH